MLTKARYQSGSRALMGAAGGARSDFTPFPGAPLRAPGGSRCRALRGARGDSPEQRLQEARASSTTHTSWTLILAAPPSRK